MSDKVFALLFAAVALPVMFFVIRRRIRNFIWSLHNVRRAIDQERGKWSGSQEERR